ncbi:hypothetical protein B0H10DRAFT_1913110 [Mycena sp. CBHHK59/15]|nr:hypothetical protein B0H10DRAFT_1913110 [Mycena sp. CBHHK59/15]
MLTQPRFAEIKQALLDGVQSLKKWFHRTDTTSTAYFICLVLDPSIKDIYFRSRWADDQYQKGMKALEKVFDKYHAAAAMEREPEAAPVVAESTQSAPLHRCGSSFSLDAVNSVQQAQRADAQP